MNTQANRTGGAGKGVAEMSCPHGDNEKSCEHCIAFDEAWDRGFSAGVGCRQRIALALRECDAALGMLAGNPAAQTREMIAKAIAELDREPT